jgi:protocatechuate 3,4-dioxygenase alpha subunit
VDPTPSQTVGPFFEYALPYPGGERLVDPAAADAIRIGGTVFDGAGDPVDDALVEVWQANRAGRYRHPDDPRVDLPLEDSFTGFGRCPTDAAGRYELVTVKPGAVPGPGGEQQAPHIGVCVLARGLLRQLYTRIYFPDEQEANAADPLLRSIADPALRSSLVARAGGDGLIFDIHLQGERQTAFLDV